MQKKSQEDSGVSLRAVIASDIPFLCGVANDLVLMEILCDEPSGERYWQDVFAIWEADPDEEDFIIIRESDGTKMGWLGINGLASGQDVVWLKMIVLLPEFWGQGHGSDALFEVMAYSVEKGSVCMRLWTDQINERSQRCYRRNGLAAMDSKRASIGTRKVVRNRVLMECMLLDLVKG